MKPVGVVHGRFQPLHHGHMEYILAGLAQCRHLLVGITNPDLARSAESTSDPNRGLPSANPFTYHERMRMVCDALVERGIDRARFDVVPFPISFPELLPSYIPAGACLFVTVYDTWGDEKLATLSRLGWDTQVLWRRTIAERFTTGSEVRRRIRAGLSWKELVPPAVASVVQTSSLVQMARTGVHG